MLKVKNIIVCWLLLNFGLIVISLGIFISSRDWEVLLRLASALLGVGWLQSWYLMGITDPGGLLVQILLLVSSTYWQQQKPGLKRSLLLVITGLFCGPLGLFFGAYLPEIVGALAFIWVFCAIIYGSLKNTFIALLKRQ